MATLFAGRFCSQAASRLPSFRHICSPGSRLSWSPVLNLRTKTTSTTMGVEITNRQGGDQTNYPKKGQTVTIHYTGKLTNGKKFDSSFDRNQPFSCKIGTGQVIKGWDEGVPQLSKGESATLTITPDYGYGAAGAGGVIPPNATLVFDVKLIDFK